MQSTKLRNTLGAVIATLLIVTFGAIEASGAIPNPGADDYTSITSTGNLSGNHPTSYTYVLNGPTTVTSPDHLRSSNLTFSTSAWLDGEGVASFGTLKSRIRLWDPGALNGNSQSLWNDHLTIVNPALTGTQGTMQLAFNLSGLTTVLDTGGNPVASDAFADLSLLVDLNPSSTSNGTRVLDYYANLSPGPMQITATPGGPTVTSDINFTYGAPFGIRTILGVWAQTDNFYLWEGGNPYFIHYGGGTIDDVTVDFLSTAELVAVVIPNDPTAQVMGGSGADYTPLVATEAPEPATMMMLMSGMAVTLWRRRRV
ncbi:MAG: PEP-CTERM sorting domain-containing protein [Phycisphaerae bacterium]|jgi:hypothetical protein|nr:PEP-CTERM sorting domain-containing protein [Phycisphaerae bacterium]